MLSHFGALAESFFGIAFWSLSHTPVLFSSAFFEKSAQYSIPIFAQSAVFMAGLRPNRESEDA